MYTFEFQCWISYLTSTLFLGTTRISLSEDYLTELPSIILCFDKPNSRKTEYEYGKDFKIRYLISGLNPYTYFVSELTEGENSTLFDEFVSLEKIITIIII